MKDVLMLFAERWDGIGAVTTETDESLRAEGHPVDLYDLHGWRVYKDGHPEEWLEDEVTWERARSITAARRILRAQGYHRVRDLDTLTCLRSAVLLDLQDFGRGWIADVPADPARLEAWSLDGDECYVFVIAS
ncbi:MAG TPA: hypothetical protein ENI81_04145 [Phycisphaerales bacterium]|nr:hypothetical protein [Phycisphaerales bacterium]